MVISLPGITLKRYLRFSIRSRACKAPREIIVVGDRDNVKVGVILYEVENLLDAGEPVAKRGVDMKVCFTDLYRFGGVVVRLHLCIAGRCMAVWRVIHELWVTGKGAVGAYLD